MKAKNLLAVILCIAVMLAMLPSSTALITYAAGNGTLTVDTASAAPGEDVTVDIVMGENPGIVCLHFKVTWDSHALTLKEYDVIGGAANYAMVSHNGNTDGQFIFSSVDATAASNYTETGKVVSLTFTVNSEHSGGSETLTITPAANSIYDCDMKLVSFTSTNGAINVVKPLAKAVSVTLTHPVTGATPEGMIIGTGYSGTVSWSGSPATFAPNTAYTATITLTPTNAVNNPFDTSSTVTMNGNTVTPATNTANSIVFTYTFPETSDPQHSLTITAGEGGEITSGTSGVYAEGDRIQISAVPNTGYRFKNWTSSHGGSFENANGATTIFTMPDNDTNITANFEPSDSFPYIITATAGTGGTVETNEIYADVYIVTLIATPNEGYAFDGWYENNVKIEDARAVYTFIATQNRTLQAQFTYIGSNNMNEYISWERGGNTITVSKDAPAFMAMAKVVKGDKSTYVIITKEANSEKAIATFVNPAISDTQSSSENPE